MDADQRIVALNKAYAAINTSEEATASERKVEYEFPQTKEEATRMMLRRNNTMDDKRTESCNCYKEHIQSRNLCGAMPELPSIISRSKRQKFYRKGCTHGINAFERNISDGDLSISRQSNDANSEGVGMTFDIRSTAIVNNDGSIFCCYELKPRKVITLKSKATSEQRINRLTLANNNQHDENPTAMALKLSSARIDRATQRLCATTTEMNGESIKEGNVKKKISKDKAAVISVPVLEDGVCIENSISQVSKTNMKKVAEPIVQTEFKTTKATDEGPSLPRDHRVITYQRKRKNPSLPRDHRVITYQRKRKRTALSVSDGNVSVESLTAEQKEEEEKAQSAEPEKSTSVPDLSSESQLEEIACQLIALSKGKW